MKEEKDVCSLAWGRCEVSCVVSMTENHTPVGSGRFRERSQDSAWILGTSCSGSPTGCATRYTSAAEVARERALLHSEHVQRGGTSLTWKAEETR